MKKTLENVISFANTAGKALFGSPVSKKLASAALAFAVALSPIVPSLAVMADESQEPQEIIEETTVVQTEVEATEAVIPSETPGRELPAARCRTPLFLFLFSNNHQRIPIENIQKSVPK